jgi:hypothetical protein
MQEFRKEDKSFERNYFRKERSVQGFTDAHTESWELEEIRGIFNWAKEI